MSFRAGAEGGLTVAPARSPRRLVRFYHIHNQGNLSQVYADDLRKIGCTVCYGETLITFAATASQRRQAGEYCATLGLKIVATPPRRNQGGQP